MKSCLSVSLSHNAYSECLPEVSVFGSMIGVIVRPSSHSPSSILILTGVFTLMPAWFFRYTVTLFRLSPSSLSAMLLLMAVGRLPRGMLISPL